MQNQISTKHLLDKNDRLILYEISLRATNKEVSDLIDLSISAVEKRKRKLNNIFGIKNRNDRKLIFEAKNKGFI